MLRVPGTSLRIISSCVPMASMRVRSSPKILIPIGVRTPVVSMSVRFLIGMVHALVVPAIFSAWSISSMSCSYEI